MTAAIRVSDASKNITGIAIRKAGALKSVTEGWIRTGGVLKQFFAIMGVALSTLIANGRGNSAATLAVTSEPVIATVTGAIGPVTHNWTRTDADPQAWTINNPSGPTATFTTLADQGQSFTATFKDTVTDQAGQVVASADVTVTCANIYFGGGYVGNPGLSPGEQYP